MATVHSMPRSERKVDYGYGLYFGLHFAGFMATTLLMTWGLFVLFFLAIGGFSLDGMMNHVQNLTSRYLAADAGGECMHVTCSAWVSLPSSVEQVRHGRTGCAPGRQAGRNGEAPLQTRACPAARFRAR